MAGLGARQHHAPLALQLALEGRQVARPEAGRIGIGDVLRQHGLPTVEPMQPALGQGHRVKRPRRARPHASAAGAARHRHPPAASMRPDSGENGKGSVNVTRAAP
jgi:hypothetical protein